MISDAMYSDDDGVIDALADFIEATVPFKEETKLVTLGKMSQVRYLLEVDESSFKASFSIDQMKSIEITEMNVILNELVLAIGLQHYRFTERQGRGMFVMSSSWRLACFSYQQSML